MKSVFKRKKSREVSIAEKHLSHCQWMQKKHPNNKYWADQIAKTKSLLGI